MSVVVFVGYISSGKSTCARILADYHGYKEFALASGVKDVAHCVFPETTREMWEGATVESRVWRGREYRYGLTPRKILQLIGTEMFRDMISPDIWVHRTIDEVKAFIGSVHGGADERQSVGDGGAVAGNAVITDCRFVNEIHALRSAFPGSITFIYIDRPSIVQPTGMTDCHKSEAEIQECRKMCDWTLVNDGGIDDLRQKLGAIQEATKLPPRS